jgi:hypothetical protein
MDFSSDPDERRHRVLHDQARPDAGHQSPPRHSLHPALRERRLSLLQKVIFLYIFKSTS